jgi:hypothetical protein
MGDESFGLNIVCEAPPTAASSSAAGGSVLVKKRKKQSKYERRRQKNKKGDNQQQQNQQQVSAPAATPLDEAVKEQEPEHDTGLNNGEEASVKQPQQEETPSPLAPALVGAEDATEGSEPKAPVPVAPTPTTTDSPAAAPVPTEPAPVIIPSRKKHNAATLEDEEERAKYMAEFHARPLEMDRRSGAKAFCTPSRDSTHLFDQTNEGGGVDTPSNQQPQSLLQQLNPKLRTYCQQHFDMDQATVIQSNTWSQFYSTKKPLANLFIQSETGSGKTLAYLLPIIQVRIFVGTCFCILLWLHTHLNEEENDYG